MRNFLILSVMLSGLAHAQLSDFPSKSGKNLMVYSETEYKSIINGTTPMCLKDRGSVLKRNAAYAKAFGISKKQCAETPKAKRAQRGLNVIVVTIDNLPESEYNKFNKKN